MTDDTSTELSRLEAELAELVAPGFSHADAVRLGDAARARAEADGRGISIRVERGDQLVYAWASAGTSADNDEWIAGKIRLVRRLGIASLLVRLKRDAKDGAYSWLSAPQYAIAGGCVPIVVAGGALVGTLTVSGLPDVDDHALAVAALRAWLAAS